MRFVLWYVFVLSSVNVFQKANAKSKLGEKSTDYPYNEVVQNLIKNWELPVVYLKKRGFLPRNYEDASRIKPNLDALMQRIERTKRDHTKEITMKVRPTEMSKSFPRNQRCFLSSTGSMLSNLEQLKAIEGQATKSKSNTKPSEQEQQLLAMKRRLEELQQGLPGYPRQIKLTQRDKDPVKSSKSYDQILQRMIEKTSPHYTQHSNSHLGAHQNQLAPAPDANQKFVNAQMGPKKDTPLTLEPIELKAYRAHSALRNFLDKSAVDLPISRAVETLKITAKMEAPNLESQLRAPTFLNWDMKKGRLDHYSREDKEAYLNQLVRVFGQNMDFKEPTHKGNEPTGS
ncbi:uncharacterized protein LOC6541650 [Drosophila erecta]|uniref:Uncharacterized protein n=1 Tax=Drosophila erecta TaxID=7220 RepID=B3NB38_DROER|nr:uncharacterized protein LOC6541650 [Drosophila erecta]EDV59803.1 uncharacterized protein Dere_GG23215 [Drosophila erecta]